MEEKSSEEKQEEKAKAILDLLNQLIDEELVDILLEESERGLVLVSHAFVEQAMGLFLRHKLIDGCANKPDLDHLLSSSLMTSHKRILACSAMGLISNSLRDSLIEFNIMRNPFAHRKASNPRPVLDVDKCFEILNVATRLDASSSSVEKATSQLNVKIKERGSEIIQDAIAKSEDESTHLYFTAKLAKESEARLKRTPLILYVLYVLDVLRVPTA